MAVASCPKVERTDEQKQEEAEWPMRQEQSDAVCLPLGSLCTLVGRLAFGPIMVSYKKRDICLCISILIRR
jgi:hypothetical protein